MSENETTETENLSVWDKRGEDLTVKESIYVGTVWSIGFTAVTIGLPLAAYYTYEGFVALKQKLKARKKAKLELVEDNDE